MVGAWRVRLAGSCGEHLCHSCGLLSLVWCPGGKSFKWLQGTGVVARGLGLGEGCAKSGANHGAMAPVLATQVVPKRVPNQVPWHKVWHH